MDSASSDETADAAEGTRVGRERRRDGGGPLLRLAVSCPRCGTRPALRVAAESVHDLAHHAPDERLGTYQCHRRHCSMIYDLTARAYQNAA